MKMIGFKSKYDSILVKSRFVYEKKSDKVYFLSDQEKKMLVEYLEKSPMIFSKTLALYDEETYIGPYMICSDGEWVWPSYFPYFIKKEGSVNENFLFDIRSKNFEIVELSTEKRKSLTMDLERAILGV